MQDLDTLNIPAYQRKRSLMAKAKKGPKIPRTYKPKTTKRTSRLFLNNQIEEQSLPIQSRSIDQITNLFTSPSSSQSRSSNFREMKICGKCEGYFENINVAVIMLTSPLKKGDTIIFEKENGLFEQTVTSMQINREDVKIAQSGSDIGVKTIMAPLVGTNVYKVI
jgi:hypothetical protein